MTAIAPYRSAQAPGPDGFVQTLHAEWTKFRTVRGWIVGVLLAPLVMVLLAFLTASGSHAGSCINGRCTVANPNVLTGPDGAAVEDSFYFVHRPLAGNAGSVSITARLTTMTGLYSARGPVPAGGGSAGLQTGLQPWAKVGLIVKADTTQGSAYAAIMLTGAHGVRMQYDYTHDIAGPANTGGAVSATSPRWLRLTRSGNTFTGYESADGTRWTKVGVAQLPALAGTVQAGLFAASPDHTLTVTHLGGGSTQGGPTRVTGIFDHVHLQGTARAATWRGVMVGGGGPDQLQGGLGFHQVATTVTVTGSGDIAPGVVGGDGNNGDGVERTLIGAFAALIVLIVLATLFITSEYRRGQIRTTLAASPRRGRVLAAKAVVIGTVAFVVGLVAAVVAMPLAEHIMRENGNGIYPVGTLTKLRVIVGTAALLAVAAVLTLAVGTLLRRSAGAVTLVIAVTVLPYIVATASVLPAVPSEWLLRLTPAAGFAIQQSIVRYPQVNAAYTPFNGYYPLAPWAGFAVLCGYTALALALAVFALRRRDA